MILGLSFGYHDAAAALIDGDKIVAAAQQERFSRIKNDASFPAEAIKFCLDEGKCSANDLEKIVYYEDAGLKFDRITKSALRKFPGGFSKYCRALEEWFRHGKFNPEIRIAQYLGVDRSKIISTKHHTAHAASAFYCSPFERALVVTMDGVGEHEVATIWLGNGTNLRKISSIAYPNSLGLLYSSITAFLGFEVNEGEYKVMGMAGYGQPAHKRRFLDLFQFTPDGIFSIDQKYFDFDGSRATPFTQKLIDDFGDPRAAEPKVLDLGEMSGNSNDQQIEGGPYADIAASIQKCTEDIIIRFVGLNLKNTPINNVCLAGGVALNSLANGRIIRELGCNLFVQPAAGDAGGALGAALYYSNGVLGRPRLPPITDVGYGQQFAISAINRAFRDAYVKDYTEFKSTEEMLVEVANLLADGNIIGWFQGRSEWGPRALGNRSILANPKDPEMKSKINRRVKFREDFRPFAPSILEQYAAEYFELRADIGPSDPERFMLAITTAKAAACEQLAATVHIDRTSRVHILSRDQNQLYYGLVEKFYSRTGIPALLNTSFNRKGEPIVNSPADAIDTFRACGLDYLVIDKFLVRGSFNEIAADSA